MCSYYEQPSVSTNFVNSMHMLRTNTELWNKFDEIKTENTFNDDLKKLFQTENYEVEISNDVIYHSKRIYVLIIKKREMVQSFPGEIIQNFYLRP